MSAKPAVHGSFTLERTYPASPERVFAAWTDPALKARWFVGPAGWVAEERAMDVRVGGVEVVQGRFEDGKVSRFVARYHELQPNRRLVYVYDMHHGGIFLSVSLATIELHPAGTGTRLVVTEQAVFVDGEDGNASRRQGTEAHLDRIAQVLGA